MTRVTFVQSRDAECRTTRVKGVAEPDSSQSKKVRGWEKKIIYRFVVAKKPTCKKKKKKKKKKKSRALGEKRHERQRRD